MHDFPEIVFFASLIFLYGLVSRLLERTVISAPMVFAGIGMFVGSLGLGWFQVEFHTTLVKIIAEGTLVVILFVDASELRLGSVIRRRDVPFRLLCIGLPITMLLGFILAVPIFSEMNLWAAALIALMLSPTDAALGQAVVKSEAVPEKIRQSINVESGINDGIALPPILICIAGLSQAGGTRTGVEYWLLFSLEQLVFGPLVGGLVGRLGGKLMDRAARADWMNPTFQRLGSVSLALVSFGLAEMINGNGFIAAFFGGLLLGARSPLVRKRIHEFGEAEGQQLSLFVFLIFGLVMVPAAAGYWDGHAWLYALLSLTVIRMVPVALCLIGTGLDRYAVLFIGWFGPRGIATILYLLMTLGALGLEGHQQMLSVIVLTVLLSIFAHGITAVPLAGLYGKHTRRT
ncbi:MAG: cation:proton antiporter [Acidobacteriota bacterium]|nr:cation:proton antiporter [Acidobacteriota bacterium]